MTDNAAVRGVAGSCPVRAGARRAETARSRRGDGGGTGIRTPEGLATLPAFKTAAPLRDRA